MTKKKKVMTVKMTEVIVVFVWLCNMRRNVYFNELNSFICWDCNRYL